ncbi:signal peptidase I [Leucobacter chromiireducens]|uniref:signal peptidase I n=1 Tax=Leucobacter chromiireducens TaxID=283877 RepID=UPI003F7E4AF5
MTRERGVRAGAVIGNVLLNIAAVGGIVCIVLVALSGFFGISIIMFKTGSMSPSIPAGSLAIVRQIPADAIHVGDVVTVDRAGMLPVTHRVTSVSGEGPSRTITMRGDANDVDDPSPYDVTQVRVVMGAVPGLARVVVWFSHPAVLGALTIAAATLVTWAFWPRAPRGPGGSEPHPERRAGLAARRGRHTAGAAALAAVCLGAGWGIAQPAERAAAATPQHAEARGADGERVETVTGKRLRLTAVGNPAAMRAMRPGVPVDWQVGVAFDSASAGDIDVALIATGDPELGLAVAVRSCAVPWEGRVCADAERVVLAPGALDVSGEPIELGVLTGVEERWYLVTGEIPAGGLGQVGVTFRAVGHGERAEIGPGEGGAWATPTPPVLPVTGMPAAWGLAVVAVAGGLGCAGIASVVRGRWSR